MLNWDIVTTKAPASHMVIPEAQVAFQSCLESQWESWSLHIQYNQPLGAGSCWQEAWLLKTLPGEYQLWGDQQHSPSSCRNRSFSYQREVWAVGHNIHYRLTWVYSACSTSETTLYVLHCTDSPPSYTLASYYIYWNPIHFILFYKNSIIEI